MYISVVCNKYLSGVLMYICVVCVINPIPSVECLNVASQVAVPNLAEAAEGADLLVFVVPHQFIRKLCDEMVGCVSTKARGITLIKVTALQSETLQVQRAVTSLWAQCVLSRVF